MLLGLELVFRECITISMIFGTKLNSDDIFVNFDVVSLCTKVCLTNTLGIIRQNVSGDFLHFIQYLPYNYLFHMAGGFQGILKFFACVKVRNVLLKHVIFVGRLYLFSPSVSTLGDLFSPFFCDCFVRIT